MCAAGPITKGEIPKGVREEFYEVGFLWRWRVVFMLLPHILPSVEGDGVFDFWIASHSGLQQDRAAGDTHTTCNMLIETVLSRLPVPKPLQRPLYMLKPVAMTAGCWVENDGSRLPKPGDCLVLDKPSDHSQAHVCVVGTARSNWMITADAGQNAGFLPKIPRQAACWVHRTYDPARRMFTASRTLIGVPQTGNTPRILAGWVDLDAALQRGGKPFRTHWPVDIG